MTMKKIKHSSAIFHRIRNAKVRRFDPCSRQFFSKKLNGKRALQGTPKMHHFWGRSSLACVGAQIYFFHKEKSDSPARVARRFEVKGDVCEGKPPEPAPKGELRAMFFRFEKTDCVRFAIRSPAPHKKDRPDLF